MLKDPNFFLNLVFKCKEHNRQAQAYCIEEGCQDRIICYICIRNSHPHNAENFENIHELFKFSEPTNETNQNNSEKFLHELKGNSQKISNSYQQVKKGFLRFDQLFQLIEANSSSLTTKSDPSNMIREGVENLLAKSSEKNTIADSPELNGLINAFLQSRQGGNLFLNQKFSMMENEVTRLFDDLSAKLEQLSNELTAAFGLEAIREDTLQKNKSKESNDPDIRNDISINQKLQGVLEDESEKANGREMSIGCPNAEEESEKLSIPKILNHFEEHATPVADIFHENKNDFEPKKLSPERSKEQTVIIIPETDDMPIIEVRDRPRTKKTLTKAEKDTEEQADNQKQIQNLIGNISNFFNRSCSCTEEIDTFEDWFKKVNNIANLDPQLRSNLKGQMVIIEAYNKTKKQLDIHVIVNDSDKFILDLKIKKVKPALRDFEELLLKKKSLFIEEYRSWHEASKMSDLLALMKGSRVNFEQHKKELTDRLESFQAYWEQVGPRVNFINSQRIEFGDYEQIIQKLWGFRVKFPAMEKLLNKYFECKEIEVGIKYFLLQSRQSEAAKASLFFDGIDEAQLHSLVDLLKLTSLTAAQSLKKKALGVCDKISFGTDYAQLMKLIDDTEKVAISVRNVLSSVGMPAYKYSLIQTQIKALNHCLFFQEMIELRELYMTSKPTPGSDLRNAANVNNFSRVPSSQQTPSRSPKDDNKMCIESQRSDKEVTSKDIMIDESIELSELTWMPTSLRKQSLSKPSLQESSMTRWLKEMAQHFSNILESCGKSEYAKEIIQMFSDQDNLSDNLLAFINSSDKFIKHELLNYYQKNDKEFLENILTQGLGLLPPHAEKCKDLVAFLQSMSWLISAENILKMPTQTFEQLYECLSNFESRNIKTNKIPEVSAIEQRLLKFEELRSSVQAIENADWSKVFEESCFGKIVRNLENHEKTYNQLLIDDPKTWKRIQENLVLFTLGDKVAKMAPSKFKLHELELVAEKAERFFQPKENNHEFMLNLHLIISKVKQDLTQCEDYQELKLSHLSEILSDLLQNKVNENNFIEIIAKIQSAPLRIKNTLSNLSVELEAAFLEKLDVQLQKLVEIPFKNGLNVQRAEIQQYMLLIESPETDPVIKFLYWVILASAALTVKKYSFKFFQRMAEMYASLCKAGIIDGKATLFQNFLREFERVKSLNSELILVKAELNAKCSPLKMTKTKLQPLSAEYLRGLKKRIETSRLVAPKILKSICIMLKRTKRYEETFESLMEKNKESVKVSQCKFNKFIQRVDNAIAVSRKLNDKIKETIRRRKLLYKEIEDLQTYGYWPQTLFEKMNTFCQKYTEFPITSKRCERFLREVEAYNLLYESYEKISDEENETDLNELLACQKKLEDFEALFDKSTHYDITLLQMKRLIWREKANITVNVLVEALSEKQTNLAEIQSLISEWRKLHEDEKEVDEPLMVSLKNFAEKISSAISEISNAITLKQLDFCYAQLVDQLKGAVGELTPLYLAKKEELQQNITMTQKPVVVSAHSSVMSEGVSQTLPFGCDSSMRHLNEVKKNLLNGIDMASQIEEENSESLYQIILDSQQKKLDNLHKVKNEEIWEKKSGVQQYGAVVIIIDSDSDNENKQPTINQATKPQSQELEPSLIKKIKSNEGSQIDVKCSPKKSLKRSLSLPDKLRELLKEDSNARVDQKYLDKHVPEIAEVIQEITSKGSAEDVVIERFMEFVAEADSFESLWGLLNKEFNKELLKKVLSLGPQQRIELEKQARDAIMRGKASNLSTENIISRLTLSIKLARKSNF